MRTIAGAAVRMATRRPAALQFYADVGDPPLGWHSSGEVDSSRSRAGPGRTSAATVVRLRRPRTAPAACWACIRRSMVQRVTGAAGVSRFSVLHILRTPSAGVRPCGCPAPWRHSRAEPCQETRSSGGGTRSCRLTPRRSRLEGRQPRRRSRQQSLWRGSGARRRTGARSLAMKYVRPWRRAPSSAARPISAERDANLPRME